MRVLATGFVLLLLVAACSESDSWRAEAAAAIGNELAGRIATPLAQAADSERGSDLDALTNAVEVALDDMTLPEGVYRIVRGSRLSSSAGDGYAAVSLPIVVVPTDTESMFCMIFALSSAGELVAEPAPGDPIRSCSETDTVRLTQP